MQEDPPGPRKAQGLPSAPDRGGPPGDVTLAPAPAGLAPPAPACFGGFVGAPSFLGTSSQASSAPWPNGSPKPGQPRVRSAEAESFPSDSGNGFRSAPAVQAAGWHVGCREPGPPLDRCLFQACPAEPQLGRQGSPAQTASPHQPPFLEASLLPLNPGEGSPRLSAQ